MSKKLKIMLAQTPHGSLDTSLGKVWFFSSSMRDQSGIAEALSMRLEDAEPKDFVRALAIFVCYPDGSLKDGKHKPDEPVLGSGDVQKFNEADLESIAKHYLEHNQYLYRRLESSERKNDEGEIAVTPEVGDIEHPRRDGESNTEYLYRLSVLEKQNQLKQFRKIGESLSSFSSGLAKSIGANLSAGNALAKTMESMRPNLQKPSFPTQPKMPDFDWESFHENQEEARWAPFNQLSDRLDELIESSIQASEFMIETNEIQTGIASEIKASGDSASRYSKTTIYLSWLVIAISVATLVTSVIFAFIGSSQTEKQQSWISSGTKEIEASIQAVGNTFVVESEKSRALIDEQLKRIDTNLQIQFDNQHDIQSNTDQLQELNRSNEDLRSEVERLRERLRTLEQGDEE